MRLVYPWLCDLVRVPGDPDSIAAEMGLRGFEVAGVEHGRLPVIDFEITANRPDCLSHVGLAREAATIWGLPLHMPELAPASDDSRAASSEPRAAVLEVDLQDADGCPRYAAQAFEVTIGSSPAWLRDRLEAAGLRPINNIVDVTNYVMLEIGQPMHAFDLDRLAGQRLVIRRARAGEPLRTLDGVERTLDAETVVIADAERPCAIGGVMGGLDSEIGASTTRIALESAYFKPTAIRRTSRRLALKTEASARFERGGDIEAPPAGIRRAAALFAQIAAGRPIGDAIDVYPAPRPPLEVRLRASRIERVLGASIGAADVRRILTALGFIVADAADAWLVKVPSYRVDVMREDDLVEEVGRHYGFGRLPMTFPVLDAPQAPPDPRVARDRTVRQVLTAAGFSESMTFAFIERQAALPFCDAGVEPAAIANPLSEKFAVLRPSLMPGLIDSCAHNRRRGRKDVRLFEIGSRFTPSGEGRAIALAWCGASNEPHWSAAARPVDFFDVKGAAELLCGAFGLVATECVTAERPYLLPGRTARLRAGADWLGELGQLLPALAESRGFPADEPIYVAEIDADRFVAAGATDALRAATLPRFPSIVRDVSIVVDEALPAAAVRGTIRSAAPPTLASVVEFDRYQGKGVPDGRVSLSLRLTFRAPDRTLTDDEAQSATEHIVEALGREHDAERR